MRTLFRRVALGLVLHAPIALAQAHSATFVVTIGSDTVAEEAFTASASALTGTLRLPQQQARAEYVIHLRPDGSIAEADVLDDSPKFFSGMITFDEKAAVDARAHVQPRRRFVMAPAATYPLVGTSIALMEELARVTHASARDSVTVQVFNIRNRILGTARLRRVGSDSLTIECESCQRVGSHQTLHLRVAPNGDVTGGADVEQGWSITRR